MFAILFFFAMNSYSQQLTIKGSVTDLNGEAIIGANLMVKNTVIGTTTDFDGNFTIEKVEKGATIVISYIGYLSQSILVKNSNPLNIVLKEDYEKLGEVMIVGYATTSKHALSGAVDHVSKENMNQGVITSPMDALKGKASGVIISQDGGDPMGTTNIRIRGTSSLSGGNSPLIIIDGVFGDINTLNALSPGDISSMTILKDASETAQYGSRGAAGVIVVTTSKGKMGATSVEYNGQIGINTIFDNLDMMSATEYRSQAEKLGLTPVDMGGNTNWLDEIERSGGLTQSHNISITSGSEVSNMRASLGVIQRQGAVKNSDMKNYTAKFDAMQYAFGKKLKLELGSFASERKGKRIYDKQKLFYSAAAYNPTYPNVKNSDGVWDEDLLANEIYNPLGQLEITNNSERTSINTHGTATWTILDGLSLKAFGSYTYNNLENKRYIPNDIKQGQLNGNGWAYIQSTTNKDLMGNIQLNYSKNIGKSQINALALMEGQKYNSFYFGEQSKGYETNYFEYNNLKAGANVSWGDVWSNSSEYSLSSYMARINYMYDDKYIITGNFRTDGSSKLGNGNKWGIFPSASVGWIMSNENFIKGISWINNLKVRAGYGVTGNQDAIDPYNSLELYEPSGTTVVDGTTTTAFSVTSNNNPDLKWEVKKTFDVGIDFSAFDNRLNLTVDYYHSKTSDLLYNYTVPVPPFTYPELLANIGEMTNDGYEFSINGDIIKNRDFTFNANMNLSFQKNELVSLSGKYNGEELSTSEHIYVAGVNAAGLTQNTGVSYLIEGESVGTFYLPHCTGISADGQYQMEDLNKDGVIDTGDSGDRQVAGQAIPKSYLGLDLYFKYKNLDLATHFNGAFGHKIYNGTGMTSSNYNNFPTYNLLSSAKDENGGEGIRDIQISDYWLEDGDYINFEYVSLGYNLDTKKIGINNVIKSLRLAFSVNNICTFTKYDGLTPMINSSSLEKQAEGTSIDGNGTIGVDDKRLYPLTRTFSLSVSCKF